jgi:hypothetical protein
MLPVSVAPMMAEPKPLEPVLPKFDIPPGTPQEAALAIQVRARSLDAVKAEIRGSIADDEDRLTKEVLRARDYPAVGLHEFLRDTARAVMRRNFHEGWLGQLGEEVPDRPPVAVEVFALATSVARWADGERLRDERTTLIDGLNGKLAAIRKDIQWLEAASGSVMASDRDSAGHKLGLASSFHEQHRRLTKKIEEERALVERLAGLGEDAARRAEQVTVAVSAAGDLAVVKTIAPAMVAPDHGQAILRREIEAIDRQLPRWPADGAEHPRLQERRQGLQRRWEVAQKAQADDQHEAARQLVSEASKGSLVKMAELQRTRGLDPRTAAALAEARGSETQLIAVVGELIGGK